MIALKLAKSGWCNNNPEQILNMDGEIVMKMFHYQNFIDEYEEAFHNLNTVEK